MSDAQAAKKPLPAVDFLKLPDGGDPYLEGHKCGSCGAIYIGDRKVCSKCGARDKLAAVKLANNGKLYVYSIVHRSFPGIQVPYISAIVDLDGGGTVKGNLINIDPNPEKIKFDMPVDVVFKDARPQGSRRQLVHLLLLSSPRLIRSERRSHE